MKHDRQPSLYFFLWFIGVCGSIDYNCEDGRFSGVRELNYNLQPWLAPAPKQVWSLEWEAVKKKTHSFEWSWCQDDSGGIFFTKKQRAEILHPGLEFDNFNL